MDFSSFFGEKSDYKGKSIKLEIEISFIDAAKGTIIEANFERKEFCSSCRGTRC